tara:strand:+ start:373 stop:603 length:231 start_codon:yes stop_codon:yes gene_type:complete
MYGSTRGYNPGVTMYKNMDIENMPKDKEPSGEGGLLSRKSMNMMNKNMNYSNPAIRVAKQMEVIRNFRNSMKNGDA